MPPRKLDAVRRRPSMAPGASILRRGRFSSDTGHAGRGRPATADNSLSDGDPEGTSEASQTTPTTGTVTLPNRASATETPSSSSARTALALRRGLDAGHGSPGSARSRSPSHCEGRASSPRPRAELGREDSPPPNPGGTTESRTARIAFLRARLRTRETRSSSPSPTRRDAPSDIRPAPKPAAGPDRGAHTVPGGPPPPTAGMLPTGPPPPTAGMGSTFRPPPPRNLRPAIGEPPVAPATGGCATGGHPSSPSGPHGPAGPPAPRPAAITLSLVYSPEGLPSVLLPPGYGARPIGPGSDHQPAHRGYWEDPCPQALQPLAPPLLLPYWTKTRGTQLAVYHDDLRCSIWPPARSSPLLSALRRGAPWVGLASTSKPRTIAGKAWQLLRKWKFKYPSSRTLRKSKYKKVNLSRWRIWMSHAAPLLSLLLSALSLTCLVTHCTPRPYLQSKADRGPKPASRTRTSVRTLIAFLVLTKVIPCITAPISSGEPRVGPAASGPEAPTSFTSRHMPANPGHHVPTLPGCRKRAFKRAILRAQHFGMTRYRGRLCTVADLTGMRCSSQQPVRNIAPRNAPHPLQTSSPRCSTVTWERRWTNSHRVERIPYLAKVNPARA